MKASLFWVEMLNQPAENTLLAFRPKNRVLDLFCFLFINRFPMRQIVAILGNMLILHTFDHCREFILLYTGPFCT